MALTASKLLLLAGLAGFSSGASAADYTTFGAPDLSAARTKIRAKDYKGALIELRRYEYTGHADVYSLIGFGLRKSGDQPQAFSYYRKALDSNPKHLGALEYQGELFVETGQIDQARQNAARLKALCPTGCEELEDLDDAIAHAPKKG